MSFKLVAASCGLNHLRPHHFRHRRLTRVCRSHLGNNRLLVLAFAGHRHVGSLQSYYRVSMEEKRALLAERQDFPAPQPRAILGSTALTDHNYDAMPATP